LIGLEYKLLPVQVDETPLPDEGGLEYVRRIAESKLRSATRDAAAVGLVITADTAVVGRGRDGRTEIFGKPRDNTEAVEMLQRLRGRTHQVQTAIAISTNQDGTILFDGCTTNVPMRYYSNEEINTYVAGGDPLDKAGAYAIQHAGFHPVEKLHGCYANVMGLPLCHLTRSLIKAGTHPKTDVPQACQAALGYNCPVYSMILTGNTQENVSS